MSLINCKKLPLFIADAFTSKPFCGNSAAVCLLSADQDLPSLTKQQIAREMNLSETAFVKPVNREDSMENGKHFKLSWFTPACEVPLCGHATLATAAVLFFECGNNSDVLSFETLSGPLTAKRLSANRIEINLPAYKSVPVPKKYDKIVKSVVGDLPCKEVVLSDSKKLLIHLCDTVTRKELESIKTNDSEMLSENVDVVGVIVTLKVKDEGITDQDGIPYDFISRYFAPWMGISEDPVTGSAHSVLAPYWSKILKKDTFYARQCSARGGELHINLRDDRVLISGNAVVTVRGQLSF